MLKNLLAFTALLSILFTVSTATAGAMNITEWQYDGSEFVEFSNLGSTSVDMTGWSFDDSSRTPGSQDLSAFGIVSAGESVILSEATADDFRTMWSLSNSVKVIGENSNNLGRSDEINLYDNTDTLIDRLTYNDQATPPGGPRTNTKSGNPSSLSVIGTNDATGWVLSAVGDIFGSYTSATGGYIANPGTCVYAVPEPSSLLMLFFAVVGLVVTQRRR